MNPKTIIKNILPIQPSDTVDVQDFIFHIWKEFFPEKSKQDILSKREELQNPYAFFNQRNGNFWCLRKKGIIVATMGIYEIKYQGEKVGFLRRFYIDQRFRNKGLGQKILLFVEEFAKEKGWEYVMFGVDKSMERNH